MTRRRCRAGLIFSLWPAIFGCDLIVGDLPSASDENAEGGADSSAGTAGTLDDASTAGAGGAAGVSGSAGTGNAAGTAGCYKSCDCDNDGDVAKSCSGKDCDDYDPSVKSTQTEYFDKASLRVSFDYDCNDLLDPQYAKPISCSSLAVLGCNAGPQGFLSKLPACGEMGRWGTCKPSGVSCVDDVRDPNRVLRCK
jgi:hypothetical protein